jgi:hypothetical protein
MKPLNEKITCKDGFHVSVQASQYHYSTPREDYPGEYTHVECGFPSAHPGEEMARYQEMPDEDPTGCVYPYVPIAIVERMLKSHGGISEGKMPTA